MSRPVTIAHFWDGPELFAATAALRSAGFHPSAGEACHAMVAPILFIALGGVRIQVPAEEAEAAAELISACRDGRGADGDGEGLSASARDDGLLCPSCGAGDYFRLKSRVFSIPFSLWFSVPTAFTTGRFMCRACGHKWRPAEAVD